METPRPHLAAVESDGDRAELLAQIEELSNRLVHVQIERDEYAQRNSELFVLQQVFSTINSTLDINDILSTVLRGVCEALKFNRVILFDVIEGALIRRMEGDINGNISATPADRARDFIEGSVLQALAGGTEQLAFGDASEPNPPLADTSGSFIAAPLLARDVIRGVLYVDQPPKEPIDENQIGVLLEFAAQAAIAVENARLYEETRRLLEETQRLALTDPLTGIANRRALNEMLERELHTAERYDSPFCFVILDIDNFKQINDSGGHSAGDQALKRFADCLRRTARKGDIVARYAGDEFIVVMTQTDRTAAEHGAERILGALRKAGIQCSIGAAMFPYDGTDGQGLLYAADEALYRAKASGKNQYQFYKRSANPEVPAP
ncbi:MAG: GGDEF domain-containing protein [Candidatus Eremiobacteraeota bacterium]|nr:GGDEF domain-containing protein [Candidatus Eremiobacteraeota bacterium]